VPWHLSVVGLLAIPLVQIHLTAAYVDLPGNLAFSALVLLCHLCYARDDFFTVRTILAITAAAFVAINTKFQLIPLTSFVLVLVFFRMLWVVLERRKRGASTPSDVGKLVLPLILAPVIFFTPVKNTLVHGNPLYPLHLNFMSIELAGPREPYSSSPPALQNSFRPTRWLYSVMEIGIGPYGQPTRWTIDQWMPPETEGHRMGGFFNFYVLLSLILFAYFTYRSNPRTRWSAIGIFTLLSLLSSLMPQSHEFRYYMYWMIVLVSYNLYLGTQTPFPHRNRSLTATRALGVISSLFLAVVLWVTEARYIIPSMYSFSALVYDKTDPAIVNKIQEKETVCLYNEPWTVLYASYFHNRNYQVKETANREACSKYRWIDVRNN
jgi:hypothetical protein